MIRHRALIGAFVCALSASAGADVSQQAFRFFPIRGVFYPPDGRDSLIHPSFRTAIGDKEKAFFEKQFRAQFPDAQTTIDDRNKRRTFAVSLQVTRALVYESRKPNGAIDLYVSITASVYFTNVMTAEIAYTSTATQILVQRVDPQTLAEPATLTGLFQKNFCDVVNDLVVGIGTRFRAGIASAKVRRKWNALTILDGGTKAGIRRDDTLLDDKGNELRVLSVGAQHVVAKTELGEVGSDATFLKLVNVAASDAVKPRVLPLIEEAPSWLPSDSVLQIFSDALGEFAPMSLVPVNPTFGAVLSSLSAQIDVSQQALREVPDLFLRLRVLEPIVYERPTNDPYKTQRVTETIAFAQLQDRSGRVLRAAIGHDHIEDEINSGVGFPIEGRREIAVKNALVDLATRFGGDLKLERADLPITHVSSEISITDGKGVLTTGTGIRAFRSIGRGGGVAEDAVVPLWDLSVARVEAGMVGATALLPVVVGLPPVVSGDRIIVEAAVVGGTTRRKFGPCKIVDQLGALELPEIAPLAQMLFAGNAHAPYFSPGLTSLVAQRIGGGTGFKRDVKLDEPTIDSCVQVAYLINQETTKCTNETCVDNFQVGLLYRVRTGVIGDGEIMNKSGLQVRLHTRALLKGTSAAIRWAAARADILDELIKLGRKAAKGFAEQKL